MQRLITKIKTLIRYLQDDSVSFAFLLRYAFGQVLAYSGFGKYISFQTHSYKLYLSKSPVAMVAFGDPLRMREEEEVAKRLLQEGDVCLDLGANIGNFSLQASSLVKDAGHVFAFEAHPETAHYAKRNIENNGCTNVSLVTCALGEQEGELYFSNEGYDDINHVVSEGGVRVPVMRLDDYVPLHARSLIKLIKLDVEGYELFVLRGGEKTFKKAQYVLFEAFDKNCKAFGYSLDEIFNWFETRGFVLTDKDTGAPLATHGRKEDALINVLAIKKPASVAVS